MRVSVAVETRVPLDDAWRWWTDFGTVGSEQTLDHGIGKSRRKVVSRDDRRLVLEEDMPLFGGRSVKLYKHTVEFEEGHRFLERGEGFPRYDSHWRFEETTAGGTRIVREMTIDNGALNLTGKLGERVARDLMERDLRTHVRHMERDLPGK